VCVCISEGDTEDTVQITRSLVPCSLFLSFFFSSSSLQDQNLPNFVFKKCHSALCHVGTQKTSSQPSLDSEPGNNERFSVTHLKISQPFKVGIKKAHEKMHRLRLRLPPRIWACFLRQSWGRDNEPLGLEGLWVGKV